jgi:exonuclease SbcC
MIRVAREEQPDYSLVSGDIFHVGRLWSDRCCEEIITAIHYIKELSAVSKQVVVMRGTPNHDGAGQFNVLVEMFSDCSNVHIVITPQVISFDDVDIAVLPGFDKGVYRSKFPGLSKEEENEVFTQELSNAVLGLKAQCNPAKKSILMSHYTVPGCNTESGQVMMLTQFEPIITQETLLAADFSLVALGHIHRPQRLNAQNWYYSGAINAMNFNDEGQERGFWIHNELPFDGWDSDFHKTPIREFKTIKLSDEDISLLNTGGIDMVATTKWRGEIDGKIVRIHYSCSADNAKAYKMNEATLEKELLDDGAFMLWENLPDKIDEFANRTELGSTTDPEANLIKYLEEKQYPPEKVQELVLKARPVISEAEASMTTAANTGIFEPVEISVKNYRNYEEETFNFEDISFCTINGQNGAGKSSLFMDAIIDCLYEEPREGTIKDDNSRPVWLREDEKARSGSIMFTFRIGEKMFRVTRTRARSGKGTLNISEFMDGEWQDCSKEKWNDTQQEILNIIGMDSLTFKSCALIMQDQYGLFLQAKPEERIEVLGTLLGLGVYQAMEKIASDKARINGAKARELAQEIEIHNNTISAMGNPDEELSSCSSQLVSYEVALQTKTDERDRNKLLLTHQQEATERRNKLLAAVTTLQTKKALAEQNRATQQAIIDSSSVILDSRAEIEAKVAEYNVLLEKEIALAGESALYSSKKKEAESLARQAATEQESIAAFNERVKQKETELSWSQPTDQDAVVKEKAAEYEQKKKILDEMQEKAVAYQKAKNEYSTAVFHQEEVSKQFEAELKAAEEQKKVLEKKVAILEESGCVDIDNAHCRFLQDAIEAKEQLAQMNGVFTDIDARKQCEVAKAKLLVEEKSAALEDIGFDAVRLSVIQSECASLKPYVAQLESISQRESKIALLEADLKHLQSNILEAEKRLAEVKLKGTEAEQERDRYAKSFEEHALVQSSIFSLKPWLEKEKQLPVAEERKATAMSRLLELSTEISNIDTEISEKQAEADKEILAMSGMEELQGIVNRLETEVNAINAMVREQQMKIGALKQKSEQIAGLRKEIEEIQQRQNEYARETANYDALKVAFSQSGVPHQIIRSIIPQLTATANSILGQMTGGKMGVEFRLERLQKNGKEKAALDIFIEEYGKGVLPYLSKSGGEKVKSSLSVILALAEIKSSSAGIQLGMLFIDEPPFLDGDGIQAYCDSLETIQSRYKNIKIMAITHDPTMKARFPQSLDVVKTENGSKVIY